MSTARDFLSLNGAWQQACDPQDSGRQEEWFKNTSSLKLSEVTLPGTAACDETTCPDWYFRTFEVPETWTGKQVELHFGAVMFQAEVWLNGIRLGEHTGGYTPFSYNVTAHIKEGVNQIALRVAGAQHPQAGLDRLQPHTGIWGAIGLEAKEKNHIENIYIQSDVRRKRITVMVEAAPGTLHLHIEGTEYRAQGEPGTHVIDFPNFKAWNPAKPTLYTLRADLIQEDGAIDSVSVRFGMREFSIKDHRFHLNGRPVYVKGVVHHNNYPAGLDQVQLTALMKKELQRVRWCGFNFIRFADAPAPEGFLELADELGIMVSEQPALSGLDLTDEALVQNAMEELAQRDRNHASLVMWQLANLPRETTGNADAVTPHLETWAKWLRKFDPSRVISSISGGVPALRNRAFYLRPYRDTPELYDDTHLFLRGPGDINVENYYRHAGTAARLFHLSEFGCAGVAHQPDAAPNPEAEEQFQKRGLERVFKDWAGLNESTLVLQQESSQLQVDSIRANTDIGGYCFAQLCDAGDDTWSGILDQERNPKPVAQTLKDAQRAVRPLVQMYTPNLCVREETAVTVLLANERRLEGRADMSLQVVGPTNQVLWKKKRSVKLPKHGKEVWSGRIAASGSTGEHRFVVRLMQNMKLIGQSILKFHVFEPVKPASVPVHVLDPNGTWGPSIKKLAKLENILSPIHIVPPMSNTIRTYPDNELLQVLAQVKGGAVALVFGPPDDWNDLAERVDHTLKATPFDVSSGKQAAYHYVKLHPVFDGLPSRGLMRQPYRNMLPQKSFVESSDEDIAGAFDISAEEIDPGSPAWGSDILVRRYGEGRVVFTHMPVLQHLGEDVVADRLFVNLLNHFVRRSVPSESILSSEGKHVEWLRGERLNGTRRWMVLGEFGNWNEEGHDKVFPPEENIELDATYPGWYKALRWRPWHTRLAADHQLDFQKALAPVYCAEPRPDYGTAYAYAEFLSDLRQKVNLCLRTQNPTKIWMNGTLVHDSKNCLPKGEFAREYAEGFIKQGRNTLLVKCSKIPGPSTFALDLESHEKKPLSITWWK